MKNQRTLINRFIRLKELKEITGLSEATLWRLRKFNQFPPPHRISKRNIGWLESDVAQWISEKSHKQ